jgi:hypothetical protein
LLATGYLRFPSNYAPTGDPSGGASGAGAGAFGGASGGNSGATYGYTELPGSVREWIEWKGMPGREVQEALRYLVVEGCGRERLLEWFMDETRRHLMSVVKGISVPTVCIPTFHTLGGEDEDENYGLWWIWVRTQANGIPCE